MHGFFSFCSYVAICCTTPRFTFGMFSAFHLYRSHLPLTLTRVRPSSFLSRSIMTSAQPPDASSTEPIPGVHTSQPLDSIYTASSHTPQLHSTQPFLPGNGPIHLAPSLTHQPEILLLHRLLDILPMAGGPVPNTTMFVDHNAYCCYWCVSCGHADCSNLSSWFA